MVDNGYKILEVTEHSLNKDAVDKFTRSYFVYKVYPNRFLWWTSENRLFVESDRFNMFGDRHRMKFDTEQAARKFIDEFLIPGKPYIGTTTKIID